MTSDFLRSNMRRPHSESGTCRSYRRCLFLVFIAILAFLPARTETSTKEIESMVDLQNLAALALARYQPSFRESANLTQSLSSLLNLLKSNKVVTESKSINCSSFNLDIGNNAICQEGSQCIPVDEMMKIIPKDTTGIEDAVVRLCPIILFQMQHKSCKFLPGSVKVKTRPTTAQVWGFGILSVFVISFCSLAGVIILPFLSHSIYHTLLMVFEGLAVGSLAGSAVFHLIPQAFGLLGQDDEHDYLWKSLIVFIGIYVFFLSERIMKFITLHKKKKKMPSKDSNPSSVQLTNGCVPDGMMELDHNSTKVAFSVPNQPHNHHHDHGDNTIATVAWMIIFGDGMHNFIDGLSIGAAFSESLLAGVSISVAVVCEEFPHELGDFAVLLGAGMSTKQALLYNFLSALTCFVGLGFGILVGDLTAGAPHIFAFAGGMFLYISLVDMMTELSEGLEAVSSQGIGKMVKVFFLQNVGILIGVVVLFVMAKYSELINFDSLNVSSETGETVRKSVGDGYQNLRSLIGDRGI